jgi:diguanylate cyclase (GGDEF)-like protein
MRALLNEIGSDNRLKLTLHLSIVGSVFLTVFGAISLFNDNPISTVLFLGLIVGVSNVFLMNTKYRFVTRFILATLVALIGLALVITGGQEATGHLWTYPLMMLAFAVLTMREGIWFCVIYMSLTSIFLFISPDLKFAIKYETITATRYIMSALALSAMALLLVRTQETASSQLKTKTVTDNLTGLFNRAILDKKEIALIQHVKNDLDSYLLLIDIDFFKGINDNFGHGKGDNVLVVLADILRKNLRASDFAIRWGGEEFLIVLKDCPASQPAKIAEKIKEKFQHNKDLVFLLGKSPTLSIGIAKVGRFDDFYEAVKRADTNLYTAKEKGRNRVIFS